MKYFKIKIGKSIMYINETETNNKNHNIFLKWIYHWTVLIDSIFCVLTFTFFDPNIRYRFKKLCVRKGHLKNEIIMKEIKGKEMTNKTSLGELFDEYEEKGCDFFDIDYLIEEGEEYAENDLEMNPHARLIMYSLVQELKDSQSKIDDVKDMLLGEDYK